MVLRMSYVLPITVLLILTSAIGLSGHTGEKGESDKTLSTAQQDFLKLVRELESQSEWDMKMLALKSGLRPAQALHAFQVNEPAVQQVQALLDFEESHRGELLGLMSLRKIARYFCRFGIAGPKMLDAKRDVLNRLPEYVLRPELPETLTHVANGWFEPEVGNTLRKITSHAEVSPETRSNAQLTFVNWISSIAQPMQFRAAIENRVQELKTKDDADSQTESVLSEFLLSRLPNSERYQLWTVEAAEILDELTQLPADIRVTGVSNVDKMHHIVVYDSEQTRGRARVSQRAESLKFVRAGASPDDFEVELLDGSQWNLSAQRGKTVVLQFSFTGCGPCQALYPALARLHDRGGNDVSILTLMVDEDPLTSRKTATKHEMNWPVCHDDPAGGLGDHWGIENFPTVVIIDPSGQISFIAPTDPDQFEALVAGLIASKSQQTP